VEADQKKADLQPELIGLKATLIWLIWLGLCVCLLLAAIAALIFFRHWCQEWVSHSDQFPPAGALLKTSKLALALTIYRSGPSSAGSSANGATISAGASSKSRSHRRHD
jgi:hypothetical protein